jgi:ATP-binding cassette subfamily C protein/ATP-binding cassette subfamily C exporter for protease/lipase/ATP-binding cassette subfamily C protein EexD
MSANSTEAPEPTRAALASALPWFVTAAGFSFVINMLVIASPIYSYQVFDRVLGSAHVDTLIYLTLIVGFAFIILGCLDGLRTSLMARIGTRLERQLAERLIVSGVRRGAAGEAIGGQPLRDLAQLRAFIGGAAIVPLFDAPWAPFFLLALYLLHPWLGLTALASAVVLFGLALANEKLLRPSAWAAGRFQQGAQRQAESALRNADVVRAMGMMPALAARWRESHEAGLAAQETNADMSAWIGGASKFVRSFVQVLIMAVGAYLVLQGQLSSGGMIAASMLLSRALTPVEQAITSWRQFIAARESFAAVKAALADADDVGATMELDAPTGKIDVERLRFSAAGGRAVVKDVDLSIAGGEAIGVVGPSASGKSTLCRLLVGILPAESGTIRLDGAELSQWSPDRLGRHLGYLPQAVELLPGTVAENIARMQEPDAGGVVAAAKLAGVHAMVLRLPDGYNTIVGEGGVPLSGGQRQRIGLARAVFADPAIVVLDEPNSNLDAEGEAALMETIRALKARGATVLVVAHRMHVLADMDRILVMRDGSVSLLGPRDRVLARLAGAAPNPVRIVQKA